MYINIKFICFTVLLPSVLWYIHIHIYIYMYINIKFICFTALLPSVLWYIHIHIYIYVHKY
jgi:hypothetical protein